MGKQKKRIMWIGRFFSIRHGGANPSNILSEKLEEYGWERICITNYDTRIMRLIDVVITPLVKFKKYDIVFIELYCGLAFLWGEIATLLLSFLGKPVVVSFRDGKLIDFVNQNQKRIERVVHVAKVVSTPSRHLQGILEKFGKEIFYMPNGLEIDKYTFMQRKTVKANIIWLRAFHAIYQPLIAAKSVEILKRERIGVKLLMIGPEKNDDSLELIEIFIREHDLTEEIEVIKGIPKDQVPETLGKADIFINTTLYESFGVGVMEAAACGLPIVTTSVGELPYLWENEVNAILVESSAEEFAKAIKKIISQPDLASKLSYGARKNAVKYDHQEVTKQWDGLLSSLINKPLDH